MIDHGKELADALRNSRDALHGFFALTIGGSQANETVIIKQIDKTLAAYDARPQAEIGCVHCDAGVPIKMGQHFLKSGASSMYSETCSRPQASEIDGALRRTGTYQYDIEPQASGDLVEIEQRLQSFLGTGDFARLRDNAVTIFHDAQFLLERVRALSRAPQPSLKFKGLFTHDASPISDEDIIRVTMALMPHLLDEHSPEFDARALLISKCLSRIHQEQKRAPQPDTVTEEMVVAAITAFWLPDGMRTDMLAALTAALAVRSKP